MNRCFRPAFGGNRPAGNCYVAHRVSWRWGAGITGGAVATFGGQPCFQNVKTFLKILLFAVVALMFVHFCPLLLVPLALVAGGAVTVAAAGLSVVAGLLAVALVVLALLAPIWLPLLALLGLISLCRRGHRAGA